MVSIILVLYHPSLPYRTACMQWVSLCTSTGIAIDLPVFMWLIMRAWTTPIREHYINFSATDILCFFSRLFVGKMDESIEGCDDQNPYNTQKSYNLHLSSWVHEFSGNVQDGSVERLKFTAVKPLYNNCFSSTHVTFIYHREYQGDNDITNREAMPGVNTPV